MDRRRELKETKAAMLGGQREADNLIKRGARIYKAKWLEEKCIEVEDGLRHHNMKKAYCLKKTLKKGS